MGAVSTGAVGWGKEQQQSVESWAMVLVQAEELPPRLGHRSCRSPWPSPLSLMRKLERRLREQAAETSAEE